MKKLVTHLGLNTNKDKDDKCPSRDHCEKKNEVTHQSAEKKTHISHNGSNLQGVSGGFMGDKNDKNDRKQDLNAENVDSHIVENQSDGSATSDS